MRLIALAIFTLALVVLVVGWRAETREHPPVQIEQATCTAFGDCDPFGSDPFGN